MKYIFLFVLVLWTGAAFANSAHNLLMKKSTRDRQALLGAIVKSAGHECRGDIDSAFKFVAPKTDYAYWRLRCGPNRYIVEIQNDETGSTKVLDCEKARSFKVDCD